MSSSAVLSKPFTRPSASVHAVGIADAGSVARSRDREAIRHSLLDCYVEGWAETDFVKILAATAPDYRFHDPYIGSFSRWSLHEYFDRVCAGLSRMGAIGRADMAFVLRGPVDSRAEALEFWREAPRIGLTGITRIDIGDRGVISERVAYDLNLASDLLRRASARAETMPTCAS
jgi:hypothetical protein